MAPLGSEGSGFGGFWLLSSYLATAQKPQVSPIEVGLCSEV